MTVNQVIWLNRSSGNNCSVKNSLRRFCAAALITAALALGLVAVNSGTAQAVTGSRYSTKAKCYTAAGKTQGTLFGYNVTWGGATCAKSALGGYRLNVYHVNTRTQAMFWGSTYSSKAKCNSAGSKWHGTFHGHKVSWGNFSCVRDNGQYRLGVNDLD